MGAAPLDQLVVVFQLPVVVPTQVTSTAWDEAQNAMEAAMER